MTLLDLVVYHQDHKDLNRTKEIKPAYLYQAVPFDVHRRAVGVFMTELLRKTVSEAEHNPELFLFLYQSFIQLDTMDKAYVPNMHLHFMVHLSRFLGFMPGGICDEATPFFDLREGTFTAIEPELLYCVENDCAAMLHQLITTPLHDIQDIKMSGPLRQNLLDKLILFYRYHVENMRELNAHLVLREVLGN